MRPEIIPQSPHACCYRCYSTAIDKICHHCGRAMCEKHSSEVVFLSPEFTGLLRTDRTTGLNKRAVHCRDCAKKHRRRRFWRYLSWLLPIPSIQIRAMGNDTLPVPTIPSISGISIKEQIQGRVTLDGKRCYTEEITQPPRGDVQVAVKFHEPDQRRVSAYKRKYGITAAQGLLFHAGTIVMRQTANVTFDPPPAEQPLQPETFMLCAPVQDQGFLAQTSTDKQAGKWEREISYTVKRADGKETPLPVQIVPVVVRSKAVALEVQLRPGILDMVQVNSVKFRELSVSPSAHLSQVRFVHPPGIVKGLNVEWKKPVIEDGESGETDQSNDAAIDKQEEADPKWKEPQLYFMRFQYPIHHEGEHATLTGTLKVVLDGTLSGMEKPLLFLPWGQKRDEDLTKKIKCETMVELDFELDLAELYYHTHFSAPVGKDSSDDSQDDSQPNSLRQIDPYPGVDLTEQKVTRLLALLNEREFSVKRVLENPIRVDEADARVTKHFWDLLGRHYFAHYPVEFHLVLTGRQDRQQNGASMVMCEMHVYGLARENANRQAEINEVRKKLQDAVDEVFGRPGSPGASASTNGSPPPPEGSGGKDPEGPGGKDKDQLLQDLRDIIRQLDDLS